MYNVKAWVCMVLCSILVPHWIIASCTKIYPRRQSKKEARLISGVVERTIKLSKLESRDERLSRAGIGETNTERGSSSQDNGFLDDGGGGVVDNNGGPGGRADGDVELGVDVAVVEVAVQESGPDEVACPVPDVHGVAVLPVVRGEVAHGGQLLLAVLDQQLRGLAAAGDEGGVGGPLDPDGIHVVASSPAVQADETCSTAEDGKGGQIKDEMVRFRFSRTHTVEASCLLR